MKILVPVKRVPDYQAKVKLKADGSDIEREGIKWIVNPFDEIAVEEALRLKEAGKATEVIVAGIGPEDAQTQLRYAMAMGADSAILVKYDGIIDSDLASRVLAEIYKRSEYGLIIMGKQAIDSDANQTAQLLAARLNLPQATFASKVIIEDSAAIVTREVDGGLETIKIALPAVISTDLRLNEPRYAPLPGIMKAKKKPLEEIEIASLEVDLAPKVKILKMAAPSKRQAGRKVESVDELVKVLQNDEKIF
ncbi:MAG: electron transfer flavoprotein subunit beta/FixA family protein [Deltaproteobacteria bacterium]|nr:electron transfer flavoprotein subunit beta/FixA family protein [Deltaproteobacteria bacterium]